MAGAAGIAKDKVSGLSIGRDRASSRKGINAVSNKKDDYQAKCPFFKKFYINSITCEGLFDNTTETIAFCKSGDKKLHYEKYCCSNYQECAKHKLLMQKYEEE